MRNNFSSCGLASPIFVNTELLSLGQLFMISKHEVAQFVIMMVFLLVLLLNSDRSELKNLLAQAFEAIASSSGASKYKTGMKLPGLEKVTNESES